MIAKILLTLDIDEEEYRMPSDGKIEEEIQEAIHEFPSHDLTFSSSNQRAYREV